MFRASLDGEPGGERKVSQCVTGPVCGSGRMCLHGEDTSATANVEYDLVLEQVLVLDNGIHVGACADFIFLV